MDETHISSSRGDVNLKRHVVNIALAACLSLVLTACQTTGAAVSSTTSAPAAGSSRPLVRISVADQMMEVVQNGKAIARYPVSTSKYGLGDQWHSYRTPLGQFSVAQKIGDGVPKGGKFCQRRFTGEVFDLEHYDPILHPSEYDSILTRIIWLRGLEQQNSNAYARGIYIHGTNQEHLVGRPVSYGCIRMRNEDVLSLYKLLPEGANVSIQTRPLPSSSVASSTLPVRGASRFASRQGTFESSSLLH
jgi:lipoprotein-anchoring transpeptidase ErfK/SrfK